jgi:hypothetical protein
MKETQRELQIGVFLPDPLITDNIDGVKVLYQDFRYLAASGYEIKVPAGYKTDFASIPRPLWWWISPHGKYERAAVIHDYICSEYGIIGELRFTSADAAHIFGFLMEVLQVNWLRRKLMVTAVILFGPKF